MILKEILLNGYIDWLLFNKKKKPKPIKNGNKCLNIFFNSLVKLFG
jgi:hypothetical protein